MYTTSEPCQVIYFFFHAAQDGHSLSFGIWCWIAPHLLQRRALTFPALPGFVHTKVIVYTGAAGELGPANGRILRYSEELPHERHHTSRPSKNRLNGAVDDAENPISFHLFGLICSNNFACVPPEDGIVIGTGAILPLPDSTENVNVIGVVEI